MPGCASPRAQQRPQSRRGPQVLSPPVHGVLLRLGTAHSRKVAHDPGFFALEHFSVEIFPMACILEETSQAPQLKSISAGFAALRTVKMLSIKHLP